MASSFASGVLLAIGHHLFYNSLDQVPVDEAKYSQEMNIRIGTGMSYLVRAFLVISVGTAYWQIFWRALLRKQLPTSAMVSTCPNAGANAIFDSLDQATLQGVMPSISYTSSSTGLLRKLQSTADFAQLDETFTSVTATLPYSVPDLAGCFASYIRENPKAGVAGTVQQPRLRPRQDVFAPLVQVQCSPFLYSSLDNDTLREQTRYNAKGLRNLNKINDKGVAGT